MFYIKNLQCCDLQMFPLHAMKHSLEANPHINTYTHKYIKTEKQRHQNIYCPVDLVIWKKNELFSNETGVHTFTMKSGVTS